MYRSQLSELTCVSVKLQNTRSMYKSEPYFQILEIENLKIPFTMSSKPVTSSGMNLAGYTQAFHDKKETSTVRVSTHTSKDSTDDLRSTGRSHSCGNAVSPGVSGHGGSPRPPRSVSKTWPLIGFIIYTNQAGRDDSDSNKDAQTLIEKQLHYLLET